MVSNFAPHFEVSKPDLYWCCRPYIKHRNYRHCVRCAQFTRSGRTEIVCVETIFLSSRWISFFGLQRNPDPVSNLPLLKPIKDGMDLQTDHSLSASSPGLHIPISRYSHPSDESFSACIVHGTLVRGTSTRQHYRSVQTPKC